jgi:CheY-like chemotaxis protein
MEGSISVTSEKGGGSCFKVILPLLVPPDQVKQDDPKKAVPPAREGGALRILFAEDNAINATFGATLLGKLGHDVVSAQNGKDCLMALENGAFDLVMMDIQMPELNGSEAMKIIRAKERNTSLHQPVIALTAYALQGDRERFLQQGFDGYLSKPFRAIELVGEIKRVLESLAPSS